MSKKRFTTSPQWLAKILLFPIIALILILGSRLLLNRGVRVIVTNKGPQTLHSVSILLNENRYPLGDIKPGETKSIVIKPTRESHLQIEHGKTQRKRIKIDCYLEKGYKGEVKIELTSSKLLKVEDKTNI